MENMQTASTGQPSEKNYKEERAKAIKTGEEMLKNIPVKLKLCSLVMILLHLEKEELLKNNPEQYYTMVAATREAIKAAEDFAKEMRTELEKIEPSRTPMPQ